MIIASTEGLARCYEVIAQSDGYLVQCRCIETGAVEAADATLFRTAPAALAFADMAAAAERYAAAGLDEESRSGLAADLKADFQRFASLRLLLRDDGIGADILARRLTLTPKTRGKRLH